MRPAVNARKKAIILGVLVGILALWWYSKPFPWLGIAMGTLGGLFTFFILATKKMERIRVYFFFGLFIFVTLTLTANILYLGFRSFMEWDRIWITNYIEPGGEGRGTSPFPLPILIPTLLLGRAEFVVNESVWSTQTANSWDVFFVFMIPYALTLIAFGRGFCGWICPLGGLPEFIAYGSRRRRWSIKLLEEKKARVGGFSPTGLTGLKSWAEWTRYGILVFVILLSLLVPFAIVNIISPALWLKSIPVFWIIIVILVIFAIVLPFFTKRRWWCDIICPVGATLALLHKIDLFRIKIDKNKCDECMDCVRECHMFAMTPQGVGEGGANSGNCIKCGRCIEACPEEAIDISWVGKYGKVRAQFITLIIGTVLVWYLWFVVLLVSYSTKLGNFRGLN